MENIVIKKDIPNVYDEVYGILKALGNNFIKKIPVNEINYIVDNMTYKVIDGKRKYNIPKYDLRVSLNLQNVSKEAISVIYFLYSNYWCTSEKEKIYIEKIISNNEKDLEDKKREKNNPNTLFNNNIKENEEEFEDEVKQQKMIIPVKQEKWYKKIFEKISKIFK